MTSVLALALAIPTGGRAFREAFRREPWNSPLGAHNIPTNGNQVFLRVEIALVELSSVRSNQ